MRRTRIIVTHYGGPDALRVVEEECPAPKPGEVRVRVLAAGVSLPDVMAREGVHPETPKVPFTPGWDLVGVVDRLGDGVSGIEPGQIVAAMPISGAYAEFVCLPQRELVPVPSGLDAAEAVSLILNYITAYQMLHRSAKVRSDQRVLIHGAAGGVGSALLQLGRLAALEMYGTCPSRGASAVSDLGGIPIDYQDQDFVEEIHRLTGDGVDVVFDSIGGTHIWRSRRALHRGGRAVAYGLTSSLSGGDWLQVVQVVVIACMDGVSVYDQAKTYQVPPVRFHVAGSTAAARLTTLLFLCLCSAIGLAQSRSGNLLGVVKGSGTPLNNVHVRLSRLDAAHAVAETVTGPDGRFRLVGLTWGNYMLDLTASGWRNTRIPVRLRSDTTVHISIGLSSDNSENANASKYVVEEDVWFGTQFDELALERLPNGRNIWSVLQMQEPSTVTNRFETAGTQAALPALFAALGASWTENQYLFNGLDVTDPYVPGLPLINPGIDSLSEFQAVVASKPAVFAGSGENLSLASPEAGDAWHGGVWLFGSGGPLQSDNENARLRQLDFPGPERLNSLLDASAQVGGTLPIASQAVPFFGSLSTQQVAQSLGGFAAPIDSGVNRVLVDFAPWLRSRQRLNLLYSGQHVFNSAQGAMPTVAPSATTRGNDNYNQFQAIWNQSLRPSTAISASFGVVNAIVSSAFQSSAAGISTIDLPLMALTGPAPLAESGLRTRYEAQGMMQSILYGWFGSHSVSFGFDWSRSYMTNRWYALGDAEHVLVNGIPSEVIRWNTPAVATQHVQNVAEFVTDAWRPARWLVLPISLRIDTSTGQANGTSQGIRWTTLEPRLGFVVPVLSDRGLVLQGSWSRYGHLLQGRYLDYGNPAALGGEVFRWQDTNADGIAQPQGPELRVFGGPYSAIDPHLARPFTDEISFGLQEKIDSRLTAYVWFFRRDDHRRIGLENTGVPFSDYTPVQYPDPGYDGIYGTADDQIFTLYNEKPSALGQDFLLLTNPDLRASYKGLQAFTDVRWWKSFGFSAALTTGKAQARTSPGNSSFENDTGFVGSLGVNPNTVLMSLGRTYFDRAFVSKVSAYYTAPYGFHLAAIATYLDGTPFGRLLFVNGFNQGPFYVRATPTGNPGGFRTQHNATIDVRLARDFRVQRGTVFAYLDVFNVMNWNSNTQESALTGPAFPLRVPLSVEAPRTIRLGTAWRF